MIDNAVILFFHLLILLVIYRAIKFELSGDWEEHIGRRGERLEKKPFDPHAAAKARAAENSAG
ncbi:MAG: hypothetical protein AAGF15_10840 [Pseudomonadota bacterium]